MFDRSPAARLPRRAPRLYQKLAAALCLILAVSAAAAPPALAAQLGLQREFNTPIKASVNITNRNGRVMVIASEEQQGRVTLKAESAGAPVGESDVTTIASGGTINIDVRARREEDRIDLTVRVPSRAIVRVQSEAGAVDVIGNVASAQVVTNTGTIHADVPLDAVNYNFIWEASRPRFMSDVELEKIKEKAGGWYVISGKLGDKKAQKDQIVKLVFMTQRGVVLLNVDPSMVPTDLRERPLTEAARAIIRSGDSSLIDAIRKVSPRLFGDYAKTMPPPKEAPSLVKRRAPGEVATAIAPQLMRLNASVTDRQGRAIGGLKTQDFTVFENGEERKVTDVAPTSTPFNLVLLLDVSGSVEERIDFIRKAARDFLRTVSSQDRISIISFRDDIQIISEFTTDRGVLSERLEQIDAGGATALYDALAYVLVDVLKPVRGERTAIVVMSDGDDNRSFVPFNAVLQAVIESGAVIYPLYVPSGLVPEKSSPTPNATIDPLRTRFLTLTTRAAEEGRRLASASGGVYYPISRIEDLQSAYDDVVTQLRTAYTITYASNAGSTGDRRLRVRTSREGASVRLSPVVSVAAP
jgi:VWFA-related protein